MLERNPSILKLRSRDTSGGNHISISGNHVCQGLPHPEGYQNPRYVLTLWATHGGESVFHDCIRDGAGEITLIGRIGDEPGLVGVAHETAFQEDGWMPYPGENTEAGTPDSSIGSTSLEQAGAVHGSCESDVCGILGISVAELEIILANATSIVGHSGRREGKGLDALGASTATRIEVNADEYGILKPVSEIDTFREGKGAIRVPGHNHLEATGFELLFKDTSDSKVVVSFHSVAIYRARIIAAVAWIDDDGVEGGRGPDVGRAQDRIDQLAQVKTGDEVAPLERQDLEAEDELHVVHEDVLPANGEPDLDRPVLKFKERAFHLHGLEPVELLDAADGDVVLAFMPYRIPAGCGR